MSSEGKISWELMKNVADALDSYRVRALIDAKKEILEAGIYTESQYYDIILKMFDDERLKYQLYDFLKNNNNTKFETITKFAQKCSIDVSKSYSLLELLKNENLVIVEEIFDEIKGEGDAPPKSVFKDLIIKVSETESITSIKSIFEPVSIIFENEICSGCGLCAGICPVNCLQIYNGFGKIDEERCIRCGLCYFVCPRSYLPVKLLNMVQDKATEVKDYDKIGSYIEVYSARTKIKEISEVCQDGGISSTCLYYLLDKNKVDAAIGAKMSNTLWRPEPLLIEKKEDIIQTAGTKYVNNPNLQILNQSEVKDKKLAVVGVPCQMQALLKSKIYNLGIPTLENIKYRIGIFCMESFSYENLLKICEVLNTDVNNAKKMDINKGKFFVFTNDGEELTVPIKEISHLGRIDCEYCFDLTSESADISVGSIGSPSGWNTVIIRTKTGKELLEELIANKLIESKPIDDVKPGLPLLQRIAGSKRSKCDKHISAKKDKNIRFPNY